MRRAAGPAGSPPGPGSEAGPGRWRLLIQALAIYYKSAPFASCLQVAVSIVPGLAPAVTAWLTGRLLDRLAGNDERGVPACALALAGAGALVALALHVGRYTGTEIARRVALRTQAELFAALNRRQDIRDLEDPAYQDRLRLAQQSSQSGPRQLVTAALGTEQAVLTIGGFLVVLLAISPLIAVLVLASAVPMLWAQLGLGRRRTEMLQRTAPRFRRQLFYSLLLTDVRAAKEIRLFNIGGFLRTRMLGELRGAQDGERDVDRATLRMDGSFSLLTALVSGIVLVTAALRTGGGPAGVATMTVLIMALGSLQGALAGIAEQAATANQAVIMFGYYSAIVDGRAEPAPGHRTPAPPLTSGLELHDVWFRYHPDHDWILKGVSLRIDPGQCVALVGLNGAGKSTLVKLICGLYEPTRGAVHWNGADIRDLDPDTVRARISAVFQDYMSYEMSAAENIAIGDLSALQDEQRLRAAASGAGVDQVLDALPQGYQTMLSRIFVPEQSTGSAAPPPRRARRLFGRSPVSPAADHAASPTADQVATATAETVGVTLSGGQWQRLALARAVLRTDADLLILDEPASGLDAIAESEIARSLQQLRSGRSSLLISHRLSAMRTADHIVVLEGGRITEQGDHDSLMNSGAAYARLFRTQAAGYQLVP
jgi:ATP-binding cassette, subfamily B, bacterial